MENKSSYDFALDQGMEGVSDETGTEEGNESLPVRLGWPPQ